MAFFPRYTLAILLAFAVAVSQGEARHLLQDHTQEHDDHAHEGKLSSTLSRLDFNDQIDILELRGLWYGEGDQYSYSVYSIFDDTTSLPNCSAHVNEYNYSHYSPDDDHFILISGVRGAIDRTSAAHKRTTPTRVTNYTNNVMGIYNNATGATSCSFFKPYIDLRSGHLKAEIINMNMYSRNSTGQRVSQSLNCQVVGNELPGCYTSEVSREPSISAVVQSQSVGNAAQAPAPQISIPNGAVVSVNIQTYVCRNGECLTLAPKFEEGEHSH